METHEDEAAQSPVGKGELGFPPTQLKPGQQVSEVPQRPPPRPQWRAVAGAERQAP